ncbi:hypothetical protein TRFO_06553 [Tritrichomonas foetus]|uniref:KANL2-like probable zinc-finger domain-containing protein n=1 Tax=Tritrichomonas foetus TaxID=1144522 RepID=A0A1J4JXK6_9EUKA|nr:hypothetical protein TRFO_06553 [Tritrichomonas foetus]|eukprot:OHT03723.1 hypothetical protein TRFO_06553 [Tritrichomonas foetus]
MIKAVRKNRFNMMKCDLKNLKMRKSRKLQKKFNEILANHGVGTVIPDDFGPETDYLNDIPSDDKLVPIHDPELTILEPVTVQKQPPMEELSKQYANHQMYFLLNSKIMSPDQSEEDGNYDDNDDNEEEEESDGLPKVDFPGRNSNGISRNKGNSNSKQNSMPGEEQYGITNAFASGEELENAKRDFEKAYNQISRETEINEKINVCSAKYCLEAAVPGFKYCVRHIGFDEEIDNQALIKRCNAHIDGQQCCCPVFTHDNFCVAHQYLFVHNV